MTVVKYIEIGLVQSKKIHFYERYESGWTEVSLILLFWPLCLPRQVVKHNMCVLIQVKVMHKNWELMLFTTLFTRTHHRRMNNWMRVQPISNDWCTHWLSYVSWERIWDGGDWEKEKNMLDILFTAWILACNSNSCGASCYCVYSFYSHTFVRRRISAVCRIRFWCGNSNCSSICIGVCTLCMTMVFHRSHWKACRSMMSMNHVWFHVWSPCRYLVSRHLGFHCLFRWYF